MKSFLKPHRDGTLVTLKVIPRSSKNEIGETPGSELRVKVTAPPVDSAANRAVVELIAETVGCSKSRVELIKGATSRHKILLIRGLAPEDIAARF